MGIANNYIARIEEMVFDEWVYAYIKATQSERLRDKMIRLIKSETVKPPNDKQG